MCNEDENFVWTSIGDAVQRVLAGLGCTHPGGNVLSFEAAYERRRLAGGHVPASDCSAEGNGLKTFKPNMNIRFAGMIGHDG